MGRIQTAAAGLAIAASAAMYGLIGVALTAYRMMMPCNWLGQQVPQGTPGSWG